MRRGGQPDRRELLVFGVIGLAATATHYVVALAAVHWFSVDIFGANVAGFTLALSLSFFGHGRWSFRVSLGARRFVVFLCNALFLLGISQLLLYALNALALRPALSLLIAVLILPGLSYLTNKFWVFQRR